MGETTAETTVPTNRRRLLGRGGLLATGVLGVVVALGGRGGNAAPQTSTESSQPQRTEQPAAPNAQHEHLVPVPPENCDYPWEAKKQDVTDKGNVTLDSMRRPQPKETQGKEECWEAVPNKPGDNTTSTTNSGEQPEVPPVKPATNAQEA